ncbi:hypothetical protein [Saccharothrix deserti]|uniref:hypothetical protein n=1 Tax=Saccharothrix deserti TaxID=2593674 RepID=UPI00131BD1BE|nr:hypothetical protein [Saccharothrix deserti]
MVATSTHFTSEKAPCGRLKDGEHHREDDGDGFIVDHVDYACGCRRSRHEFHDGSVRIRVVRHDGKVLSDERSADHEA